MVKSLKDVKIGPFSALAMLVLALAGCRDAPQEIQLGQPPTTAAEPETLEARAQRLAHETLIVDTHVDVPYRLFEEMEDISVRTEKGEQYIELTRIVQENWRAL